MDLYQPDVMVHNSKLATRVRAASLACWLVVFVCGYLARF